MACPSLDRMTQGAAWNWPRRQRAGVCGRWSSERGSRAERRPEPCPISSTAARDLITSRERRITMSVVRDRTSRGQKRGFGSVAMAAVLCLGLAAALPVEAQDLDWATRAGGTGTDIALGKRRTAPVTATSPGRSAARRRSAPARPTRRCSPQQAATTSSSPGTMRAARWSGPNARGNERRRGLRHRDGRRRQQLRDRGVQGHGDVRPRRGQRDHAHGSGSSGHLRRQIRCDRRADLGRACRWDRSR